MKLSESYIKRLKILSGIIKENNGPFNDAGEPMMTHNQYRDYSEPNEDNTDDSYYEDYHDSTPFSIIKELEGYFNTKLKYNKSGDYHSAEFPLKIKGLYIHLEFNDIFKTTQSIYNPNNYDKTKRTEVGVVAEGYLDGKKIEDWKSWDYVDDVDFDDLTRFLKPYKELMFTGEEAKKEVKKRIQKDSDDYNSSIEDNRGGY